MNYSTEMENSCVWEENKKLIYIKCMWCIDGFQTDPESHYESEVFSPVDEDESLKFQLSVIANQAIVKLKIQFPYATEIDFHWKPFMYRPCAENFQEMNNYVTSDSSKQKNCKQASISGFELQYLLPTSRIIAGFYIIINKKNIQSFDIQTNRLYFSDEELQNFQTKWNLQAVKGIKITSQWTLPNFNFNAHSVSPEFVAGSQEILKWNFVLKNAPGRMNNEKFEAVIEFRQLGNYSIGEMIWKLSIINLRKNTVTTFDKFRSVYNTLIFQVNVNKNDFKHKGKLSDKNPLILIFEAMCWKKISNRSNTLFRRNPTTVAPQSQPQSEITPNNRIRQLEVKNECYKKRLTNVEKIFATSPHFSDVKLKIGNKDISTHKLILSAASPIFFEMLSSDVNLKEIEIIDENFEAMLILNKFSYDYELPQMNFQEALDVLKASHKYQIQDLKEEAEKVLIANINEESIIDLLVLSDDYAAENLKQAILNYIGENRKSLDFRKFEEISLKNNSSALMLDIIKQLAMA